MQIWTSLRRDVKQVIVELLVWAARVLSTPISVNDSIQIGSVMMADPLIHQHGQLQNVLLNSTDTSNVKQS